ncbi:MAG: hypothetical protein J7M34_02630 [Anaerolineae bacterium]|nr:hypothetical protein [Anaerolineae bacterium]
MTMGPHERSWWQRLLLWWYVLGLRLYFRWLKCPLSTVVDFFKPKSPWRSRSWPDLERYADWLQEHADWRHDPLGGVLDTFPSLAHLQWQLDHYDKVQDDCDGLAYFSAANIARLADRPEDVYVVSLVLDPFEFSEKGLLYAAHVICVFRHEGMWRVISNQYVEPGRWSSFAQAVVENSYTRGHRLLFCEARDRNLRFVANGNLERVHSIIERQLREP